MEGGRRLFTTLAPFTAITSLGVIKVPAGFDTDLASTPRAMWAAFSPLDEYLECAIPHDWGYSELNTIFTRKQIDDMMLELMFNVGIAWPRRGAVYSAVRNFGGKNFKGSKP